MTRARVWIVFFLLAAGAACGRDPKALVARGDEYLAARKYREAVVEYRSALQRDPQNVPARLSLARTYVAAGDLSNAAREYQRAADLVPNDAAVQLEAGQALLLLNRYDEARSRARKVLDRNPRNVEAQVMFANALAGLQNLDGAVKEIEQAIEMDPKRSLSYANLGAIQFSRGNREQAEVAYRNAVALDPSSLPARLAQANFLWACGRAAEAEASLKAAIAIDPKNALAHRALAALYLGSDRAPEAEPHLQAAADAAGGQGLRIVLADYYVAQRRNADAIRVLEQVAKTPEGFASAGTRIAAILYEQGQQREGRQRLGQVLARLANDPQALTLEARFLLAEGKHDEAMKKVTAAVAANSRYSPAHYLRGILSLPADPAGAIKSFNEVVRLTPRAVLAHVELARLYLAQGNSTMAVQAASEAARFDPDNYQVHELLARALLAHGEVDRAEQEVRLLARAAPKRVEGPLLGGVVALTKNDRKEAASLFERALAADPLSNEALTGLVQLDLAAGRTAQAGARVRARLARTPRDPAVHLLAADVAQAQHDQPGIERSLRNALEADPACLDAYLRLGRLFVAEKRLPEAQREFETLAARQPRSVAAHTMVAMVLQVQGKLDDAQRAYEKVLAIDSHAPIAANNLALLYSERGGSLDVALQLAQTAKAGLPTRPEVNDTLGWLYYKKGLPALAVGPLLQATDQAPKSAMFQFHAGMALARAGNKAQARTALQAALALDPGFEGAAEARSALAALK